MADVTVIDLTGDAEDDAAPAPAQAATQQQDTHVVAIYCGEKGLAVCGVRADLRQKRPARQYVVLGFEVVPDAGYLGPSRTPPAVLAGMVQRSQVLNSVLNKDNAAYVVLTRNSHFHGAEPMARETIDRKQQRARAMADAIRAAHPHAQVADVLHSSTNTAVNSLLQTHPKRQAQQQVAGGAPPHVAAAALAAVQTYNTPQYRKVKSLTRENLVEAAKNFLASDRVSMADAISDAVQKLEQFKKPHVANIRDLAAALWMAVYTLGNKPAKVVERSSTDVQPGADAAPAAPQPQGQAAAAAGGGAGAAAGLPAAAAAAAAAGQAFQAAVAHLAALASGAAAPGLQQPQPAPAPATAAAAAAAGGDGGDATNQAAAAAGGGGSGVRQAAVAHRGPSRARIAGRNGQAGRGNLAPAGPPAAATAPTSPTAAAAALAWLQQHSPPAAAPGPNIWPATQPQERERPVGQQHKHKRRRTNNPAAAEPLPFQHLADARQHPAAAAAAAGDRRAAADIVVIGESDSE